MYTRWRLTTHRLPSGSSVVASRTARAGKRILFLDQSRPNDRFLACTGPSTPLPLATRPFKILLPTYEPPTNLVSMLLFRSLPPAPTPAPVLALLRLCPLVATATTAPFRLLPLYPAAAVLLLPANQPVPPGLSLQAPRSLSAWLSSLLSSLSKYQYSALAVGHPFISL